MNNVHSPDFKVVAYRMNAETGRYQKQPAKMTFQKLPYELKIEPTQEPRLRAQGAATIITGRFVNKKREFFSGLRPTGQPDWYAGDDFEYVKGNKVNSLVLFKFAANDELLTIFYFNRYYKQSPTDREAFINHFINGQK